MQKIIDKNTIFNRIIDINHSRFFVLQKIFIYNKSLMNYEVFEKI